MSGKPDDARRSADRSNGRTAARARTLAEWVSLAVSGLLILSLVGFLLFDMARGNGEHIVPRITVRADQAARVDGRHVLPVDVRNDAARTLRDLDLELRYTPPDAAPQTISATIDYLGEGSTQRLYFHLDADPRTLRVEVLPLHYKLD